MNKRHLLCVLLLAASTLAQAQTTPPAAVSPAKKELVAKLLQLQQPGIEGAARGIVQQPALQMLQEAGRVMQAQIPAERREAVGKSIEADVKKYVDEAFPPVRERALKLAPSTFGAALEEKFSEDELRQLIAWFESPVQKKFQQASVEMQSGFMQKLVAEARPLVEPKLKDLEQKVRAALGVPAAAGATPPAAADGNAAPKPAARPPAKAASR